MLVMMLHGRTLYGTTEGRHILVGSLVGPAVVGHYYLIPCMIMILLDQILLHRWGTGHEHLIGVCNIGR